MLSLDQIIKATKTQLINQGHTFFNGVGVNAKKNLQGKLFFALKGGGRDTHPLIPLALENKASGIVLEYGEEELQKDFPDLTIVKSPLSIKSLQDLGAFYRQGLLAKIVGITGSNGKTTVKEFSQQLIATYKKTSATKGNFNNHWGVPLTLLEMDDLTEVGIVEMGMNHLKEISSFVKIAKPDVVICTNVAQAHIEQLGSIEKIALAKEEIYEDLKPNTLGLFNKDNFWTNKMHERFKVRYPNSPYITYSAFDPKSDIHLYVESSSVSGLQVCGEIKGVKGKAFIPIFGEHNINNLMAAAAIGLSVGLTPENLWQALPQCKTPWGRNQIIELKSGANILFDAYNANPESMAALLQNVSTLSIKGKKIGVFGDMKELGDKTLTSHQQLGTLAAKANYEKIFYVGHYRESFLKGLKEANATCTYFLSPELNEELAKDLANSINKDDFITIKSSRDLHLEQFIPFCQPLDFKFYDPHSL